MKTFTVEKEYMWGNLNRVEVLSDGAVAGDSYPVEGNGNPQAIVLGYLVNIYDDNMLTAVKFYPAEIDASNTMIDNGIEVAKYNKEELLEKIKSDFPPSEYDNFNW